MEVCQVISLPAPRYIPLIFFSVAWYPCFRFIIFLIYMRYTMYIAVYCAYFLYINLFHQLSNYLIITTLPYLQVFSLFFMVIQLFAKLLFSRSVEKLYHNNQREKGNKIYGILSFYIFSNKQKLSFHSNLSNQIYLYFYKYNHKRTITIKH